MAAADWVELVQTLPSLLWVVFAFLLVMMFRQELLARMPHLRSIELPGGIKAQFDAAVEGAIAKQGKSVDKTDRTRLDRRIARDAGVLRGATVLWSDDDHGWTVWERKALATVGVVVETTPAVDDALKRLASDRFDLVITDMRQGDEREAGARLAGEIQGRWPGVPVIIYTGTVRHDLPLPIGAFGIADRPDELLNLVVDALERVRDEVAA